MAANALFKILTLQSRFFHNFFNIIPVLKREILMHCETNENFISQGGINQTLFAANALLRSLHFSQDSFIFFFKIIPVLKREILMHCETNENFVSQRGINQTFFVVVAVSLTQGEIQN